ALHVASRLLQRTPAQVKAVRQRHALQETVAELNATIGEWQQLAQRHETEFAKLKAKLKKVKDQYLRPQGEHRAGQPGGGKNKEAYFREQFLKTRFLSDHKIPGIGPNREVLLASYGIETAFDVEKARLAGVRGIGPVLTKKLFDWRKSVAAEFVYDP